MAIIERKKAVPFRNPYADIVAERFTRMLRERRAERAAALRAIGSRAAAERYRDRVRSVIRTSFSPMPPRTPLNTRTTGTIERPGYRVEKVVFESRPGCPVTANLYLPAKAAGRVPAVLGSCGHSANGKAEARYQEFCRRLVLAGFAVLIYDPLNQGERDQYPGLPARHPLRMNCCHAHNTEGKQMELIGEYLGAWRAWDAMRALDCLLERPEIDPSRVGMTGNSGGGTMTTWVWPLEDRLTMAAPSCFVTTFLANLENRIPADCEQYPPGVLAAGLEMADFLIARAPEPILLLGQRYDFFDRRGFAEAAAEVKRFYGFFGADDRAESFVGSNPHGYHPDNQRAMVSFFCRRAGVPAPARNPAPRPEADETLHASKSGRVLAGGGRAAWEIVAERARELAGGRVPARDRRRLAAALGAVLRLPARSEPPPYRILRQAPAGKTTMLRYAVETEPGILAILRKERGRPERAATFEVEPRLRLHLPHVSAEIEQARGLIPAAGRLPLCILDPRGIGESMPDENGDFFQSYGMDYMLHGHSLLFDESYLGRRTHDVLSTLDLLAAEGAREIVLSGRGQGAILALFAAVIHPAVVRTVLAGMPPSFLSWTQTPVVTWPSACFVKGILAVTDIPECLAVLGKSAKVESWWGSTMAPVRPPRPAA